MKKNRLFCPDHSKKWAANPSPQKNKAIKINGTAHVMKPASGIDENRIIRLREKISPKTLNIRLNPYFETPVFLE
jgi:hypothetical protein